MGNAQGTTSFGPGQQTRQRVKSMQANYAGLPLSNAPYANNAGTANQPALAKPHHRSYVKSSIEAGVGASLVSGPARQAKLY